MSTQTPRNPSQRGPARPKQAQPRRDREVIDVTVGAAEEKHESAKRQKQHVPPPEPGMPSHIVPESPDSPLVVAAEQNVLDEGDPATHPGDSGDVEHGLSEADTLRFDVEHDLAEHEPGERRD